MHPGQILPILLSSVLLILAFPKPDAGVLSLVALVPLIAGLSRSSVPKAFISGWGAGTLWFFISYNWVSHSLSTYGGIPLPLAELAIILLAAVHGFYIGLFSLLIPVVAGSKERGIGVSEYRRNGDISRVFTQLLTHPFTVLLVLPSVWVLLEAARTWFPAPFPWLMMGTAFWKIPYAKPCMR
jgi:apolipoprotein N-acyltransferase